MKAGFAIALILIALISGMLGASFVQKNTKLSEKEETVAQRILRTNVLRCGYVSWAPMVIIDANTKKITGIAHDVIEAAAQKIGVKVQWTEESGWGEFTQALNNHRFDVYCTGAFSTVKRERVIDFTQPFSYSKMAMWTQSSTQKYDNNLPLINDPSTRMVMVDGTTAELISRRGFPKAQFISLPELTPISNIFQELAANKADVGVMEVSTAGDFMKKNPGQIKMVAGSDGYQVFLNKFAIAEGEYDLQQLLNTAIEELNSEGVIEQILARYEPFPNSYFRVLKPYDVPLEHNHAQ